MPRRALSLAISLATASLAARVPAQPANPLEAATRQAPTTSGHADVVFREVALTDEAGGIGGEVCRFLVPADWKVEGEMHWDLRHIFNPAGARFRLSSPDGRRSIRIFPKMLFWWSDHPMARATLPQGSLYLGQEVQPPPGDAVKAITEYVVPRCVPRELRSGARQVRAEELPKLAERVAAADGAELLEAARAGIPVTVRAARVRYQGAEGKAFDVYAVSGFMPMPAIASESWGVDQIVIVEGPAEELDSLFALYETIAASTRLNLQWFNVYCQVCDGLRQMAKDASDAALIRSQIIAHAQHEISETIRRSYERRQEALERTSRAWSETIRGVERWHTGTGNHEEIELPSGYRYAWRSADGRYLMTDDSFADPNRRSNTTWTRMTKSP
jgi:hypothetical protein